MFITLTFNTKCITESICDLVLCLCHCCKYTLLSCNCLILTVIQESCMCIMGVKIRKAVKQGSYIYHGSREVRITWERGMHINVKRKDKEQCDGTQANMGWNINMNEALEKRIQAFNMKYLTGGDNVQQNKDTKVNIYLCTSLRKYSHKIKSRRIHRELIWKTIQMKKMHRTSDSSAALKNALNSIQKCSLHSVNASGASHSKTQNIFYPWQPLFGLL